MRFKHCTKIRNRYAIKGVEGFAAHIDHLYETAGYAVTQLRNRFPRFTLLLEEPECTNITFWYIPPSLRNVDQLSEEFKREINKVY